MRQVPAWVLRIGKVVAVGILRAALRAILGKKAARGGNGDL